jgi:hypothetical protein
MTFLQTTGAGTRSWPMRLRDILIDNDTGWKEHDGGDNKSGGRVGNEYGKEAWRHSTLECGNVRVKAPVAAHGADAVGIR